MDRGKQSRYFTIKRTDMRKMLLTMVLLLGISISYSQTTITLPAVNTFQCVNMNDLYHMNITKPSGVMNGRLTISINYKDNAGVSQNVGTMTSGVVNLPASSSILVNHSNYQSIFGVLTKSLNTGTIKTAIDNLDCLPPGTYQICYTLETNIGSNDILGRVTQCRNFTIQSNSTFHLILPLDGSTVSNPLPLFTWTPLLVNGSTNGVSYRMEMVQMLGLQSPQSAFLSNPLFFFQDNLNLNQVQYLLSSRALDSCQEYAWRVKAYQNQTYIMTSEVWHFKTPCDDTTRIDSIPPPPEEIKYPQAIDLDYHYNYDMIKTEDDKLAFVYTARSSQEKIYYTIVDEFGREVTTDELPLRYGRQYVFIELSDLGLIPTYKYRIKLKAGRETFNIWFQPQI